MIELDHSTLNAPPPPEPAKPITADLLLNLEIQQRRRFAGPNQERRRVSTGCEDLDGLFDSGEMIEKGRGMERGVVVGVSAEGREGEGILLSLNLLASTIIPHLKTTKKLTPIAQIIDTTGSFPLSLLAQVLKARISSHLSLQTQSNTNPVEIDKEVNTHVETALELISISRVFDISGLWEVLREINHTTPILTPTPPAAGQSSPDWPSTSTSSDASSNSNSNSNSKEKEKEGDLPKSYSTGNESEKEGEEEGIQILIIHTLTPLINDLLARKEKSEAHTLLTHLSTTLHVLTNTSNILTLLHNTTLPSNSPSNPSNHPKTSTSSTKPQPPKSLFQSTPQKPALGQIFTQFPSLHIFISKLPRTQRDAEVLYTSGVTSGSANNEGEFEEEEEEEEKVNYSLILEILQDTTSSPPPYTRCFGGLEQKWIPLLLNRDGTGFVSAFEEVGGDG